MAQAAAVCARDRASIKQHAPLTASESQTRTAPDWILDISLQYYSTTTVDTDDAGLDDDEDCASYATTTMTTTTAIAHKTFSSYGSTQMKLITFFFRLNPIFKTQTRTSIGCLYWYAFVD